MLDFCAAKVYSDIELINATQINEAYERTVKGQVKYRFVIDIKTSQRLVIRQWLGLNRHCSTNQSVNHGPIKEKFDETS